MILVYTGNGKGKTSACLGQVVRALGSGLRVAFAQFMKESGCAGEQQVLERLLGADFLAGGCGFSGGKTNGRGTEARLSRPCCGRGGSLRIMTC